MLDSVSMWDVSGLTRVHCVATLHIFLNYITYIRLYQRVSLLMNFSVEGQEILSAPFITGGETESPGVSQCQEGSVLQNEEWSPEV